MSSSLVGEWFEHLAFPVKTLINVSTLGMSLIICVILLIAILLKKNKTIITGPFALVCGALICTHICEISAWLYMPGLYSMTLYKLVFVMDYACIYLGSVAMYWYLDTYVYLLVHPEVESRKKWSLPFKSFVLGYSVAAMLLFVSSMWTGWFYEFVFEKNVVSYTAYYWIMSVVSGFWMLMSILRVVGQHKQIGLLNTCLFLLYMILPTLAFILDAYEGLATGCVMTLVIYFVIYVRIDIAQGERLLENRATLARKEAEMAETKMELMMSQIQPHFLYNALSSISYLCTENPKEAQTATNEFSSYLRGNLQFIGSKSPVPFGIELEHVRHYLSIEKRRFMNRLNVRMNIRNSDFLIPALTLQTLVENAVKYSVNAKYEPTNITIETLENEKDNLIVICDDGPGFDVNAIMSTDRRHIGLEGARFRLAEMVGGHIEIESHKGEGTKATIVIPKENRKG